MRISKHSPDSANISGVFSLFQALWETHTLFWGNRQINTLLQIKLVSIASIAPAPSQHIRKPSVAISDTKNTPAAISQMYHIKNSPFFKIQYILYHIIKEKGRYFSIYYLLLPLQHCKSNLTCLLGNF